MYFFVPIASVSSTKMMNGACPLRIQTSSHVNLSLSLGYFRLSSEPTTFKKVAEVWSATTLAHKVRKQSVWDSNQCCRVLVLLMVVLLYIAEPLPAFHFLLIYKNYTCLWGSLCVMFNQAKAALSLQTAIISLWGKHLKISYSSAQEKSQVCYRYL